MTGTGELTRLAARRDRIMLPAWVYVLRRSPPRCLRAARPVPDGGQRGLPLAASVAQQPGAVVPVRAAARHLAGRDDAGGTAPTRQLGAGLMSIFLVVRHTRADEEAGRLELVGSAAVGRQAALTAGLLIAAVANVVVAGADRRRGAAVRGCRPPASLAFGPATGRRGLVFAALAAVAAQLSGTARGARGIAFAVLGGRFLLRAVGDSAGTSGLAWLSWLSPVGWPGELRPYGGDRWWVLALPRGDRPGGRGGGGRAERPARCRQRAAAGPARLAARRGAAARAAGPGLAAAARHPGGLGVRLPGGLRGVGGGGQGDRRPAGHQLISSGRCSRSWAASTASPTPTWPPS